MVGWFIESILVSIPNGVRSINDVTIVLLWGRHEANFESGSKTCYDVSLGSNETNYSVIEVLDYIDWPYD